MHDIAALAMLVGFIIHIYEGTAAAMKGRRRRPARSIR
jgi:hypothetical protein